MAELANARPHEAEERIISEVVIPAANQGWKADPTDHNQPKFFPLWNFNGGPAGARFSLNVVGTWCSMSLVGVRFGYKDEKTLRHVCNLPDIIELYQKSIEGQ